MPSLSHHREPCALEDELVRAEIALWRRQLALPYGAAPRRDQS